jgi:hypothetical protein
MLSVQIVRKGSTYLLTSVAKVTLRLRRVALTFKV